MNTFWVTGPALFVLVALDDSWFWCLGTGEGGGGGGVVLGSVGSGGSAPLVFRTRALGMLRRLIAARIPTKSININMSSRRVKVPADLRFLR